MPNLFISTLFNDAVSNSDYILRSVRMMMYNDTWMWKERIFA
jgi:hypothetical protein